MRGILGRNLGREGKYVKKYVPSVIFHIKRKELRFFEGMGEDGRAYSNEHVLPHSFLLSESTISVGTLVPYSGLDWPVFLLLIYEPTLFLFFVMHTLYVFWRVRHG
jgi:hypothetical protein